MATTVEPQRLAMNSPIVKTNQKTDSIKKNPLLATAMSSQANSPFKLGAINNNEDNCLDSGYYVHKKSLGEGGFGKVRLATHLKTNQKVAVKIMNKEKLGQDIQRVRIEIEALKVLQHENIAKLLQVIETKTEIFLILEYCSGGELFDYLISKKRLSESEVRVIIKNLFQVLFYIHSRGFAHRDLKPENILFDDKHTIKLIDFGLAANSSQNKSALAFLSTCCGSPAYAAPELLRGLTYSGPGVDVWSAGVLLFSLLVGQLPFDDENINNLYKKIQIGNFTMPQWLSSDVRDLINSMLRVNPAQRISVSKVLEHRWIKRGGLEPNQNLFSPPTTTTIPEIDEEAFKCCQMLFPSLTDDKLRDKIKEFGYHTATYLLLQNNSDAVKAVKESSHAKTLAQQHQRLNNNNLTTYNSPRISAIKRKLQLDCDTTDSSTPVANKRTKDTVYQATPRPQTANVVKLSTNNTPRNPNVVIRRKPFVATPLSNQNSPRIPVRLNDKTARRIVSPKMRTTKPTNNNNNCENKDVCEVRTPKTVPVSTGKNVATPAQIKSPLREINNQVVPSSPSVMKTPVNSIKKPSKTSTSKKSLLKRIMASATPAKSHLPRNLTTSTHSNNITLTSFKEPQQCIDRLVYTLASKGVECKQKDFSLKCYLNDKIHSPLKFDLEICRFNGFCVIHRKRLKGDAWNYKKICELILQLSNEQLPGTAGQQATLTNSSLPNSTSSAPGAALTLASATATSL